MPKQIPINNEYKYKTLQTATKSSNKKNYAPYQNKYLKIKFIQELNQFFKNELLKQQLKATQGKLLIAEQKLLSTKNKLNLCNKELQCKDSLIETYKEIYHTHKNMISLLEKRNIKTKDRNTDTANQEKNCEVHSEFSFGHQKQQVKSNYKGTSTHSTKSLHNHNNFKNCNINILNNTFVKKSTSINKKQTSGSIIKQKEVQCAEKKSEDTESEDISTLPSNNNITEQQLNDDQNLIGDTEYDDEIYA